MTSDFTQRQSIGGLQRSELLSLQATVPPGEVPGYKVERLLGQGAFGQVWLGSDLNTGRQVAIKFYLHCGGVDWSLLRQEVKHLVSMSTGRYIVQVLGVGWDAEPPYYIMEYLENGSLEDHIRARDVLTIAETLSIFREIAEGLSYAHGKGVLHCDLKPANVMLDHGMRPRLADFGQSRMSDDQTPSLGTLFFMAPEQADLRAAPDAAWDVYALGAIAYTMLVGSPPYRNADAVEKLDTANSLPQRLERYQAMLRHSPRPRLHSRRRGVDKALCHIIDRCLAPDPVQRYRNVQQVIAAIDQRHHNRARRPLVLMGVLGPIFLLILMFWFSSVSIAIAKRESLEQVEQLALRGNMQTAKYAKSTLEGEIKSLFQLVELEASRTRLASALTAAVTANESTLAQLASQPAGQPPPDGLVDQADRQRLNQVLESSLKAMMVRHGSGDDVAIFSTLLVNEARGTNLAIAFANSAEMLTESPVGRNFAYRSYFNGQRADGDRRALPTTFSPTRYPHLSASFRSTTTGRWKLGISAPIWPSVIADLIEQGQTPPAQAEPLGVLVLTVNLGDFVLLGGVASGESQFTTLVDGRTGNQRGTLLQHPFIEAMNRETMLKSSMPQMDQRLLERLLQSEGIVDYVDPSSTFPGGQEFAGMWLAAMAQVQVPGSSARVEHADRRSSSDLWVLVQERRSTVSAPVRELGSRLQYESTKALYSLLFVILALWFFGVRFGLLKSRPSVGSLLMTQHSGLAGNISSHAFEPTTRSDH